MAHDAVMLGFTLTESRLRRRQVGQRTAQVQRGSQPALIALAHPLLGKAVVLHGCFRQNDLSLRLDGGEPDLAHLGGEGKLRAVVIRLYCLVVCQGG